jgi:DNA-binding CsgD family transcriptional regulator
MSVLGARADAVRESIAELCERPPAPDELFDEAATRLRRVVHFDTGALMPTDPETLLPTALVSFDSSASLSYAHSKSEVMDAPDDVNNYVEMLRTGQAAAALGLATGGDLDASHRYREVHVPHGQSDELRLVARGGGSTWGIGCLSRADDTPNFSADEVRYVATIAEHLGLGLRRAPLRQAPTEASKASMRAPGMLVLAADGGVEASTGEADRWLSQLVAPFPGVLPTPIAVCSMQAQANAATSEPIRAARLRVQLPGGWLLIHADALRDDGVSAGRVAVVLEPADRAELMPLLLALHGLTEREREVTKLLVAGLGTDQIAQRLHISRHTLRDHVKSIFGKVGVSSRPELTAALAQDSLAA